MTIARSFPYRWPRLCLAAAVLVLGFSSAVAAHGVLEGSTPAHSTVLQTAPERLELRFNEPIDPRLSTVALVRDGRRIPLEPLSGESRKVTYRLPSLPPGLYVVDWRVISTVDGHLTRGSFAFGVGQVSGQMAPPAVPGPAWPDVVARWTGLVGVILLIGSTVAYLWLPQPEAAQVRLRTRWFRLAAAATIGIAVSGVFRVASDAAAIAGSTSLLSIAGAPLLRVLGLSQTGHDLIIRLVAAVFMTVLLRPGRPLQREGLLAVVGVLLIGPVLTSHGLTLGPLGVTISLLHIIAASVWVGGLAYFGALYLPVVHAEAPDVVRPAALRFSRLALISVGVLVLTGVAQGWLYVGSPAALIGSGYGRTLLIKLIIITPLLAIAAINRWRVLPRLAGLTGVWRSLLLLVRLETALALTVALVAAAVAITQPAKSAQPAPIAEAPKLVMGGTAGDLTVTLALSPARQGANSVDLAAVGSDGKPVAGEVRYLLRVMSLSRDLPAMTLRLDAGKDGKASGPGPFIGAPGWWSIHLTVRRRGVEDISLMMPLLIDPPAVPPPSAPDAMALLKRAEKLIEGVRTWRELEHYSSGAGYFTTTQYVFAVPDRLVYQTNLGSEGRVIGRRSHFRERGSAWTVTNREKPLSVSFRFPLATEVGGATLGTRTEEGDRTYQIVTYDDPGGKLHFAAWIDLATGLPMRIFMVGEAHHMVSNISGYNAPVKISPP